MKNFIYVSLIIQAFSLQASWIIVNIDNQTDLILLKAVRNNNIEIDSISQLFKDSQNKEDIKIPADALFGTSGGCKIIAQSLLDNQIFEFLFLGDFTHRIANGRSYFTDLDSRNAAAFIKNPIMARVFQLHHDAMKLIGFVGFDQDNQQFKLILSGSAGNYEAQLRI